MRQSPSGGGGALWELGAAEIKDRPPRAAITASELTRTPMKERCIQPPKRRSKEPLRVRTGGWRFLAGILRVWETPPGGGQTMRTRARHALATGICLVFMGTLGRGQGKPEAEASARHIQPERLWATLQKLGEFGKNPEGGVSRVGFTDVDLASRAYVMGLMREAGLEVKVDPAGNIFGRRAGSENLPVLLFGSHIDSVPHGGNFDGDVGSLGAIEVTRSLNEQKVKTRHPLEVVVWTNEEGGRFYAGLFGSSAAAGLMPEDVGERRDDAGEKLSDWLKRMGGDASRIKEAKIAPRSMA